MKSHPFRILAKIPFDVTEGSTHTDSDGDKFKITKIKSVKFLDMRTIEITGLCVNV